MSEDLPQLDPALVYGLRHKTQSSPLMSPNNARSDDHDNSDRTSVKASQGEASEKLGKKERRGTTPQAPVDDDAVSVFTTTTAAISEFHDVAIDLSDVLSNWPTERLNALMSSFKTAPWHTYKYHFQTIERVLTGLELAKWLMATNFAKTPNEIIAIGSALINRNVLFHVSKKKIPLGYKDLPDLYYTDVDLESTKPGSPLRSKVATGVQYRKGKDLVTAVIQERQRRAPVGWTNEMAKGDPPAFSMEMSEVPLPAVGDATPDQCEWVLDWEVVVSEATDPWWVALHHQFP